MLSFLGHLLKVLLACLILGAVLTLMGVTTPVLLGFLGLTPEDIRLGLETAVIWSIPRIVLGAVIIVPAWLIIYIFMPPRAQ